MDSIIGLRANSQRDAHWEREGVKLGGWMTQEASLTFKAIAYTVCMGLMVLGAVVLS